jgi:hypothetical protein
LVVQTEFNASDSTPVDFGSAVQVLARWVSPLLNYLVRGMVPVDLVVITSPGEVELYLDADRLGITSPKGSGRYQFFRAPGKYVVTAKKQGYYDDAKPVSLPSQTKVTVTFPFKLKRMKAPRQ